jgi:hypothetical protein
VHGDTCRPRHWCLGEQLLGVVLTDRPATGGGRRDDGVRPEALGDREDVDPIADP